MDNKKKMYMRIVQAVFLLIIILAVTFSAMYRFQKGNRRRIITQNSEYIKDFAIQVESHLEYNFELAKLLIRNAAEHYAMLLEDSANTEEVLDMIADKTSFDRIAFVSADGNDYSWEGRADVSDRDYFIKGMQGENGITFLEKSRITGRASVVFYAPVKKDNTIIGVLIGHYHIEKMKEMILGELFGAAINVYITHRDGTVIMQSDNADNKENILADLDTVHLMNGMSGEDILQYIEDDTQSALSYETIYNNTMLVCAAVKFNSTDWILWESIPSDVTGQMIDNANTNGTQLVMELLVVFLCFFSC